jgi:hypothetical protein
MRNETPARLIRSLAHPPIAAGRIAASTRCFWFQCGRRTGDGTVTTGGTSIITGARFSRLTPVTVTVLTGAFVPVHVPLRSAASTINIVDLIPANDSAETDQNSEPSLAVDPLDPTKIIAGAFSSNTAGGSGITPSFLSTDGGTTWSIFDTVLTGDKSPMPTIC